MSRRSEQRNQELLPEESPQKGTNALGRFDPKSYELPRIDSRK
jgi:hypothetical protein